MQVCDSPRRLPFQDERVRSKPGRRHDASRPRPCRHGARLAHSEREGSPHQVPATRIVPATVWKIRTSTVADTCRLLHPWAGTAVCQSMPGCFFLLVQLAYLRTAGHDACIHAVAMTPVPSVLRAPIRGGRLVARWRSTQVRRNNAIMRWATPAERNPPCRREGQSRTFPHKWIGREASPIRGRLAADRRSTRMPQLPSRTRTNGPLDR